MSRYRGRAKAAGGRGTQFLCEAPEAEAFAAPTRPRSQERQRALRASSGFENDAEGPITSASCMAKDSSPGTRRVGFRVTNPPVARMPSRTMAQSIVIRQAAPEEMEECIAIDDDACALYEQAGLRFDIGPAHPFARSEHSRWARAARDGNAFLAQQPDGRVVGLLVMGLVDDAPYLEQISVRTSAMRRGIGRLLVARAIEWAAREAMWLTTYAHLPWNRPFYERFGFQAIREAECPPEILAILAEQRRWLPAPEERIAMQRPHDRS